ncbi:MAG: hypothetical protein JSU63_00110 [Phycisphaerales bacterium]|nr:MAG: hypothetical protein JSU63_00110 [Phycisphaerales bacterium]
MTTRTPAKHYRLRAAVGILAVLALISLALEFGFDTPPLPTGILVTIQLAAVVVYVYSRVFTVATACNRLMALRSCWLDGVLLIGAAAFLIIELERPGTPVLKVSALYVGTIQVVILLRLIAAGIQLNLLLSQSRLHPTRVLAVTFISLILLGGLALSLPRATHEHVHDGADFSIPRHLLNCLFTATSATCVTGLVVYDTGGDFTLFGQVIILVLIQAGGLGIMIFGSALSLLVGKRMSLRHSLVLQDAISHRTLGQLRTMVVVIVVSTFAIEGLATVMMYPMWHGSMTPAMRLFHSVFHSVSAFCNAGFALQADSLIPYRRAWQVYGCVMPLIVLGGLGFPVLYDLWQSALARFRRHGSRRVGASLQPIFGPPHRLTLHTKLVVTTTVILIILPTPFFVAFETPPSAGESSSGGMALSDNTIADASIPGRFADSLFYAITCRTAGFNTVAMDTQSMSPPSHLLSGLLMFVGGSPASTAGGIKTVGLAVLILGVWSTLKGREKVEAFDRTIPDTTVRRAAVIVLVMMGLISAVTLAICFTEQVSLREAAFESASACGTVGLSTGLTPDLTLAGRTIIMAAMFAGRLGPLTVLIALAGGSVAGRYEYPSEQVGIG